MTRLVGSNSAQCPSNNLAHPVVITKNDDATTSYKFDQIDLIDGIIYFENFTRFKLIQYFIIYYS